MFALAILTQIPLLLYAQGKTQFDVKNCKVCKRWL